MTKWVSCTKDLYGGITKASKWYEITDEGEYGF